MPDTPKQAKGRAKEAAGALTGDDELKREGKTEQAGEKAKREVDKGVEKAKEILNRDEDDQD